METKKVFIKYFKNTGWLFTGQILQKIIAFIVNVLIIRNFGPEKYGIYSYALGFAALFNFLSEMGLRKIIVRDLVNEKYETNKIMGSSFFIKISGAVLAIITIAVSLKILDNKDTWILILIISFSMIFKSFDIINLFFQSAVKSKFAVFSRLIAAFICSIIKIIFIILNYSLVYFCLIFLLEFILLSVLYIIFYTKTKDSILNWRIDFTIVKSLLKNSWPLLLSGMSISIYFRIDQVMIKNMISNTELGFYATAVKICETFNIIPLLITSSIFPAIVKAKSINNEAYKSRLQALYELLLWLSIIISVLITIFSNQAILFFFKKDFTLSSGILSIYIWSITCTYLLFVIDQYLITENFTIFYLVRSLTGAILNIILNIILIPVLNAKGAAIATLISYFSLIFILLFHKKARSQLLMILKAFIPLKNIQIIRKMLSARYK